MRAMQRREGVMSVEIERKFLLSGEEWRRLTISRIDIRQGYLAAGEHSSTRVRLKGGKSATLTVKSRRAEIRRVEVEVPIAVADAEALFALSESAIIRKVRHIV